jgi:hypothetical protein
MFVFLFENKKKKEFLLTYGGLLLAIKDRFKLQPKNKGSESKLIFLFFILYRGKRSLT